MTDEQILVLVRKIRGRGRNVFSAFLTVLAELAREDQRR